MTESLHETFSFFVVVYTVQLNVINRLGKNSFLNKYLFIGDYPFSTDKYIDILVKKKHENTKRNDRSTVPYDFVMFVRITH